MILSFWSRSCTLELACCAGSPHGHGRTPGHFMEADLNNEIIIELDESNVISDTLAGLSHPGIH